MGVSPKDTKKAMIVPLSEQHCPHCPSYIDKIHADELNKTHFNSWIDNSVECGLSFMSLPPKLKCMTHCLIVLTSTV